MDAVQTPALHTSASAAKDEEEEGRLCWLMSLISAAINGAPSPSNLWLQLCSTCSMVGVPALSAENSVS